MAGSGQTALGTSRQTTPRRFFSWPSVATTVFHLEIEEEFSFRPQEVHGLQRSLQEQDQFANEIIPSEDISTSLGLL